MDRAGGHRVSSYYEPRLPELHLTNEFIDEKFERISEFMSPEEGEALKRKYARLERLIIYPERLSKIAKDIVDHFNKRCQEIERKAMVVTISKVAVRLYEEIVKHLNAPSVAVGPKMVTVVDMLLTGFDVPCLHTMYFGQ